MVAKIYKNKLYDRRTGKKGEMVINEKFNYATNKTMLDKMFAMMEGLKECKNNKWLKQNENTSLGKLLFNNGYYDSADGKLHPFSKDILFFGKIYKNFTEITEDDKVKMNEIKQKIFCDIYGKEQGDYICSLLACGLMGERSKAFAGIIGDTNSGKSTLTMILKLALDDYFGTFSGNNCMNRNTSQDEGQIMRWAMLLRNKRIIMSNEIKEKYVFSATILKKISSSIDDLNGRKHGGDERQDQFHFLAVFCVNDFPMVDSVDDAIRQRAKIIKNEKSFAVEVEDEKTQIKADKSFDKVINTEEFQLLFIKLLIYEHQLFLQDKNKSSYTNFKPEPQVMLDYKNLWADKDKLSEIELFENDFIITGDENDIIPTADLQSFVKNNLKQSMSYMKFINVIKNQATKLNKKIETKKKKIKGKTENNWFGIKRNEE